MLTLGLIRVVPEFMECMCSMLVSPATCQHRAAHCAMQTMLEASLS